MEYFISAENGISDFYFCKKIINGSNLASIHSHFELIFILDGELIVTIDKNSYSLKKKEMLIIMPYEVHSYSTPKSSDIFIIACPPDYMNSCKSLLTGSFFQPPVTDFDVCVREIIKSIILSDMKDDLKKQSLLYYALSKFTANCELISRDSYKFDTYRMAIAYISTHYTENISLDCVAKHVGVSSSHLSRLLNQNSTTGFSDILNALRIHNAKRLIEETDISITEAAYESGYGSIRSFNRIFKKFFGVTPNSLKRKKVLNIPMTDSIS